MDFETLSIHSGFSSDPVNGATAVPIYNTVSYSYDSAAELARVFQARAPGYVYTRIANPTNSALENRLAVLDEGVGCIATASGMSAITAAMVALLRSGDHIVAAGGIFGGTVSLFDNTLSRFNIRTSFVDAAQPEQIEAAITEETRLIFLESIGNPRLDVPDFERINAIAEKAGLPLIVDNTVMTPAIFNPGRYGADIVVYSTSKFINGHGTAIGGAIIDTGNYDWKNGLFPDIAVRGERAGPMAFLSHLRNLIHRDLGGCAAPATSFAMLEGLGTLALRMDRHCHNARILAEYLQGHPSVKWINYPGLPKNRFYDASQKYFNGKAGALLTFSLGGIERAYRFIDALKIAKNLANIGDAKTLVIHPASTIFAEFSAAEREKMGIDDGMIRVSTGLENAGDIINDFKQAIEKSQKTQKK